MEKKWFLPKRQVTKEKWFYFINKNSINSVIFILYRVWWYLSYGSENKLFYFYFFFFFYSHEYFRIFQVSFLRILRCHLDIALESWQEIFTFCTLLNVLDSTYLFEQASNLAFKEDFLPRRLHTVLLQSTASRDGYFLCAMASNLYILYVRWWFPYFFNRFCLVISAKTF